MDQVAQLSKAALLKEIYATFKRGDVETFSQYFDDDSILKEADSLPYGGTHRGRAAIMAIMAEIPTHYSSFTFDIHEVAEGGDLVMAYGTMAVTSAKTGKSAKFSLAEVWEIIDGRVKMVEAIYGDTKMLMDALSPDPA